MLFDRNNVGSSLRKLFFFFWFALKGICISETNCLNIYKCRKQDLTRKLEEQFFINVTVNFNSTNTINVKDCMSSDVCYSITQKRLNGFR